MKFVIFRNVQEMAEQYYLINKSGFINDTDEKYCDFLGPHPFTGKMSQESYRNPNESIK